MHVSVVLVFTHELVFMLQFRMVLLLFANSLTFLLHLFNYVCYELCVQHYRR